jgi:hypothetical protein
METSGLFIERLRNFRKIRDLQKLFFRKQLSQQLPSGGTYLNHSEIEEQKIHGSPVDGVISTSLGSLVHQRTTHSHLAAQAAMSYWQPDKSSVKIIMSYGGRAKNAAIT